MGRFLNLSILGKRSVFPTYLDYILKKFGLWTEDKTKYYITEDSTGYYVSETKLN